MKKQATELVAGNAWQEPGSLMLQCPTLSGALSCCLTGGTCTNRHIFIQCKAKTFCPCRNICKIQKKIKKKNVNTLSRDNWHCFLRFPPTHFSFWKIKKLKGNEPLLTLHPDSPVFNILPCCFYPSLLYYLEVICRHHDISSLNISEYVS